MATNTLLIQSKFQVEPTSAVETAESAKSWLGRNLSKAGQAISSVASKVWSATIEFFKNSPRYIRSGFGIGTIGGLIGIGLLTTAYFLKGDKYKEHRIALIVTAAVFTVAGVAAMIVFGRNPVSFARPVF